MTRQKILGYEDLRRSEVSSAVILNVNTSAYNATVAHRKKVVGRNEEQDTLISELKALKAQLEQQIRAENE